MKNNLRELDVTLEALYNNEKQIEIHVADQPYVYSVILKDWRGFDCKISSFGANLYTRTNKGVNSEQYNSLGALQTALKRKVKQRISDAEIQFTLTDDVILI
jgi:hypothetical protein